MQQRGGGDKHKKLSLGFDNSYGMGDYKECGLWRVIMLKIR